MIGKKLSPILNEIADTILEFNVSKGLPPKYDNSVLESATYIFMSVMADKMWELQEKENMDIEIRQKMGEELGHAIKKLIWIYTGIDSNNF